ncbi:MAG: DUF1805 domain-containing protein [Methanocellales archaeon]|nr:DUF1805 domain-containing protein [Methanocellales archaeon]
MITIELVDVDGLRVMGIKVELTHAPVLLLVGKKGFVGCGYFSVETANKLGDVMAIVSGVSTFEDMLNATIISTSEKAQEMGIVTGMKGKDAVKLLA